jgi:hypothetical protein
MLRKTRRIFFIGGTCLFSPRWLFVGVALTNCLLFVACTSPVPQKSRELAQVLEKSSGDGRAIQPLASGNARARVYLDASLSMGGYVTGQLDNKTTFDNFIDKLGDYLPGCRIFKFGQGDNQDLLSPANFDRSIHTRGFYSLTYNPNDALIRQINSDEDVAFSVIVTDGVQSDDPGQGNPPVVEAILEWLKKGGTFGIFVLRSGFKGPFYSEHVRDWIRNENGSREFDIASRPFYAFVLSPTQHEFDELRVKILRDFPDTGVMVIGDNSVTCDINDSMNGPKPYGKGAPQWRWFKDPFGRNPKVKWDQSVECKLDPEYPASRLSLTAQMTTYPWNGNDFARSEAPAAAGSGVVYEELDGIASPAPQSFLLKFTLVPDVRSKITFYRVRTDASLSDLRSDIRSLNTEDDSDPRDVEKTYRLSSLLIALTEAHLKAFVREHSLPRLYLTVENK